MDCTRVKDVPGLDFRHHDRRCNSSWKCCYFTFYILFVCAEPIDWYIRNTKAVQPNLFDIKQRRALVEISCRSSKVSCLHACGVWQLPDQGKNYGLLSEHLTMLASVLKAVLMTAIVLRTTAWRKPPSFYIKTLVDRPFTFFTQLIFGFVEFPTDEYLSFLSLLDCESAEESLWLFYH